MGYITSPHAVCFSGGLCVLFSRTQSLDADVSASGFTKEMQRSLEEELEVSVCLILCVHVAVCHLERELAHVI